MLTEKLKHPVKTRKHKASTTLNICIKPTSQQNSKPSNNIKPTHIYLLYDMNLTNMCQLQCCSETHVCSRTHGRRLRLITNKRARQCFITFINSATPNGTFKQVYYQTEYKSDLFICSDLQHGTLLASGLHRNIKWLANYSSSLGKKDLNLVHTLKVSESEYKDSFKYYNYV